MNKRKRSRSPAPKKKSRWSWIRVVATSSVFVAGCAAGFFLGRLTDARPAQAEMRASGYTFVNPLIDCGALDTLVGNRFTALLKEQILRIIAEYPECSASVFYRDLLNNPSLSVNPEVRYHPASLTKIPVMMAYFKHAEDHPGILDKRLTHRLRMEDYGVLYPPGQLLEDRVSYPVRELIRRMIVHSDNASRVLLVNDVMHNAEKGPSGTAVPLRASERIFTELALDSPNRPYATMTARQVSSFFRILYNSSYLGRRYSEEALKILSEVEFRRGLRRGIPDGIPVAHKFGEASENTGHELHDCGIVYHPDRPYLLCVMTRGPDASRLPHLIGEISKTVYRRVSAMK